MALHSVPRASIDLMAVTSGKNAIHLNVLRSDGEEQGVEGACGGEVGVVRRGVEGRDRCCRN